jgi:ribosomal protein S18 acetylase RimI-like enzyme
MKIRPARPDDLREIASIHATSWKEAYAGTLPAHYLEGEVDRDLQAHWERQELLKDDVLLVAETDAGLVGFAAVWCRPDAFIDNLHVSQPVRSKGIGAALMRAAADRLMAQGHSTAYLWVFESNAAAIRFYERLGAVRVERAIKEIYGHRVASVRMEWSDLRAMSADVQCGGLGTETPASRQRRHPGQARGQAEV